jgi:hypothetical protein
MVLFVAFGLPRKGTWRLQILLATAEMAALVVVLTIALILNGLPYWQGWWFVMAAFVVGALPASMIVTRLVEWVIAGYRTD